MDVNLQPPSTQNQYLNIQYPQIPNRQFSDTVDSSHMQSALYTYKLINLPKSKSRVEPATGDAPRIRPWAKTWRHPATS